MAVQHCPNGHLIFHTLHGSGCIVKNCPYMVKA